MSEGGANKHTCEIPGPYNPLKDYEGKPIEEEDTVGCRACWMARGLLPFSGVFQHYSRYEKGILFTDGGWDRQPSIYCEVMESLASMVAIQDKREHEERMRDMKKKKPVK